LACALSKSHYFNNYENPNPTILIVDADKEV
jgi:hypothetical protein